MPTYRIPGIGHVHLRGRRLPDPCDTVVGIGERRHRCDDVSEFLCDWRVAPGRTCDRALCAAHAIEVGKNKHYCPEHHAEHVDVQSQPGLFTGLVGDGR